MNDKINQEREQYEKIAQERGEYVVAYLLCAIIVLCGWLLSTLL